MWLYPEIKTLGGSSFPLDTLFRRDTMPYDVATRRVPGMGLQLWITQFRKGLVELCVMATLAEEEEAYGYQIVERLGQVSGLTITESTIYPLLARLGRDHLLSVRTAASPIGPPRRYYRLTEAGQRRL